ncbi:MAG: tyrosine transporter [Chlamydiae bacterium]|nr:tyrosine transporter [Chlamydiota bacterium]
MLRSTTFSRYLGGILLVAGTTIGAGMLALPVSTAFMGFYPSLLLFFFCWLAMLATAFFFLDVNFSIPGNINLISMAGKTLGTKGKVIAWVFYLLLLYSLVAAYIAGSASLFQDALQTLTGYSLPSWFIPFILPLIFGWCIYMGTLGVDWINKILMVGLIVSYGLLVFLIPSHIKPQLLRPMDFSQGPIALSIIITSFGYHIIIPSLTHYMNHDKKHLIWTLVIGSLIALVVYVIWQLVVLGTVPIEGKDGLAAAWKKGISAAEPLSKIVHSPLVAKSANFFSFFAIVTSFLGVSLSLSDFLTDGLKLKKTWESRLLACALTFAPPIVFVFASPRGFIVALQYAGACVAILLILLPSWMAWHLKTPKFYKTLPARLLIVALIVFSFLIVALNFLQQMGYFQPHFSS